MQGLENDSMCVKIEQRTKEEVNNHLKDKYRYFISILIMHIVYDFDLWW